MSADSNLCGTTDHLSQRHAFLCTAQASGKPSYCNAKRCKPSGELAVMLFAENFGLCHHRNLNITLDGLQCSERGDHCFAAADITLQQAPHWIWLGKIVANFCGGALLR